MAASRIAPTHRRMDVQKWRGDMNPGILDFAVIPAFDLTGVLPPYLGSEPTTALRSGSPYASTLVEIVTTLGTTASRRALITGLIGYRAELRSAGVQQALHWLDGSFVEQKDPRDIDLFTIIGAPTPPKPYAAILVTPGYSKSKWRCDAYHAEIGTPAVFMGNLTYWYGLFSHQRGTGRWKGILALPLSMDLTDDRSATTLLAGMTGP